MRPISNNLVLEQQKAGGTPYVIAIVTGDTTYDSEGKVLAALHQEGQYTDYCEILLDNSDKSFSSKTLTGSKVALGFGYTV